MSTATERVWAALEALTDPEIPVVTLRELGILREVNDAPDGLACAAHASAGTTSSWMRGATVPSR